MNKIAIIPARSGSKGLKDKNVIDICGKPLLAYSIEAALKSSLFEKVILSTDSEKYAQIGESFGAEIMMRGEKLSDDKATTFMVIEDILSRLESPCDYFVLLQPTSPLRNGAIFIAKTQQYLNQKHFFGVKSMAYKMNKVDSVDIDDELDYKFACLLMGEKKNG